MVTSSAQARAVRQSASADSRPSRKLTLASGTNFVVEARFNRDNTFQGVRLGHEGRGAIYCPARMIDGMLAALGSRSPGQKRLALSDYWQLRVSPINDFGGKRNAIVVQALERGSRNEHWRPGRRITITRDQAPEIISLIRDFVRELRAYLIFEE